MKLKYNLFGCIPTTHDLEGFSICISSYGKGDPHGSQTWTTAATYLGAIFTGWRLARMYAKLEGQEQFYFIYSGTDYIKTQTPLHTRKIRVTKTVAFFSN